MHDNIFFNDSPSPYFYNQSQSDRKAIHDLHYPKQPEQLNQLEPSVRNLIQDYPSFCSYKHKLDSKQQQGKQYVDQPVLEVKQNLKLFDSKSLRLFKSFTSFLDQNPTTLRSSLKDKYEIIWHFFSMVHLFLMLIYIPIQYTYELVQFNQYQIGYLIISIFVYFRFPQLIKSKRIHSKYILLKYFFKYRFLKDLLLIICLITNYYRINLEIDCLIIIIIFYLSIQELSNIWIRFFQFKLDFYLDNLLTLAFKIIIIINTISCLVSLLEKSNPTDHTDQNDDSFVKDYKASTQVSLSILTFNYQGDQEGIEIQLIAFFSLFLAVYLLHSFNIILSRQGIEIHSFFKSNNFDYVLREKLVNSINKQRYDSKIHFPQQLSDEIKVNQRLPLLLSYFKGYDTSHLKDIAINSEEITFYPSESIILKDVPDDCSIYFLLDGYAEIKSSSFVLQSISGPYVFGEMSFYTQQPRQASVVALTQCIILKVPRQVMIAGLGQVEKVLQHPIQELFHEQKDQISLNNKAPIECFCCKSNRHCIAQCNVFRIQINPEMLQSLNQTRCEYIRKMKKSLRIIPEQKYSKLTLSPSKTELKVQSKKIPFLYESNKSEPLLQPASICEQKSNISLKTKGNLKDKIEKDQQQKQKQLSNQFQSVQEEVESEEEYSESFLNTNTLTSNWDVNPPVLHCESNISKIPTFQENTGIQITVPHTNGMSMSSFQDQATQIQDLQFAIIQDFDQCQLFSHYFPTWNFDIIIGQINKQKGLNS